MLSVFLKRVLPFALTLLVGIALGGFANLFRTQTSETNWAISTRPAYEGRRGCSKRFMYSASNVGRLVSIQRQTDDGSWVPTRPVGPEIYEMTTRPAVIRSRPEAFYTEEARREGVSGTVMLEATLAPDGRVTDIQPRWQLTGGLTTRAVEAARQLEFLPALRNNRPVAQRILLEYRFER